LRRLRSSVRTCRTLTAGSHDAGQAIHSLGAIRAGIRAKSLFRSLDRWSGNPDAKSRAVLLDTRSVDTLVILEHNIATATRHRRWCSKIYGRTRVATVACANMHCA
jgi:hypothetical protein